MHIIAVGLNYRTAPVEIREKFAFSDQDLPRAITELKETKKHIGMCHCCYLQSHRNLCRRRSASDMQSLFDCISLSAGFK